MYNAVCDYAKLVICKHLPYDMSEEIFKIAQAEIQKPVKEQFRKVCNELITNSHAIYLNLLSQVYERYIEPIDNHEELYEFQPEDFVTAYYIKRLAFDVSVCSQSIDINDAFHMLETFLIRNKAKEGYILAMKYILSNKS